MRRDGLTRARLKFVVTNTLSLPQIKSVRIDGAALQERASLGCARRFE